MPLFPAFGKYSVRGAVFVAAGLLICHQVQNLRPRVGDVISHSFDWQLWKNHNDAREVCQRRSLVLVSEKITGKRDRTLFGRPLRPDQVIGVFWQNVVMQNDLALEASLH